MNIRRWRQSDFISIEHCNYISLPESYSLLFYIYHALSWPELTYVAEDENGKILGYVMAKLDEESDDNHGYIASVAVKRSYRLMGLAQKMIEQSWRSMIECYSSNYCTLHVRKSNRAALNLYSNVLGFTIIKIVPKYYSRGTVEDAYVMRKDLIGFAKLYSVIPADASTFFESPKESSGKEKPIKKEKISAKCWKMLNEIYDLN